jgi:zona occludens toxin (predicted ATPase)
VSSERRGRERVTMKIELTHKDRIMIYILVIFLVVFAIFWTLILPQMNRSSDLDASIDELETEQLPIQEANMAVDTMKTACDEASDNLSSALEQFYPYMQNYEIDKMLTSMMIDKYSLKVDSLTMSDSPAGVTLNYYQQITESSTIKTTSSGEDAADYIPILTSSVSITAEGTREQIQTFVDDLFTDYPSMRVTSYSITDQDSNVVLDLSCDVYMKTQE